MCIRDRFSGMPAEIDPKAGGAFTLFGGMIVGRNIELITNQDVYKRQVECEAMEKMPDIDCTCGHPACKGKTS